VAATAVAATVDLAGIVNKLLAIALAGFIAASAIAQETPNRRDITVVAHQSTFEPNRIEVLQNDLVRITLKSDQAARSFAVDAYRISKRVPGGGTITFEFHANQAGTFSFYCNLTSVPDCREMTGTLVVNPK
jgi:heme/copper-type cytochrome/quinol oxidase subunit 2